VSLAFLSPSLCAEGATTSPLRRALEGADPAAVRDLSLEGIVELRGDLDAMPTRASEELLRLSPRRGFLFTDEPVAAVERARAAGVLAYDATGAYAGIALASEQVMRRLTDLDLEAIPTAGSFAHVTALFRRDAEGWFRVYVHQELGHYVAEAVLDAIAGLEGSEWR
jgi:sarcosine oxidase gamma subunit